MFCYYHPSLRWFIFLFFPTFPPPHSWSLISSLFPSSFFDQSFSTLPPSLLLDHCPPSHCPSHRSWSSLTLPLPHINHCPFPRLPLLYCTMFYKHLWVCHLVFRQESWRYEIHVDIWPSWLYCEWGMLLIAEAVNLWTRNHCCCFRHCPLLRLIRGVLGVGCARSGRGLLIN